MKHNTGNILTNGSDVSLDDTNKFLLFIYDETLVKWVMVGGGGGTSTFTDSEFIPVDYMLDDTTAPDASETLVSTNKVQIRNFQGASANQSLRFTIRPKYDLTGATITFNPVMWVSQATAPANTETIIFTLACASVANSALLSTAVAGTGTNTFTAAAGYAQYDAITPAAFATVTPTGLAGGLPLVCQLTRDQGNDTYAQKIGLEGIWIKYSRTLAP